MWKSRLDLAVASLVLAFASQAHSTGMFMPIRWLDNGGVASDRSPEFYWELEVKRLAKEFAPTEKLVLPGWPKDDSGKKLSVETVDPIELREKQRDEADIKEFDDAIKTGRIKPDNVELAKKVNRGDGEENDKEFPSEFADYHRGAEAFTTPDTDSAASVAAWEGLLKRPKEERHYRSVWAAFMLGKAALYQKKPEAVKWFQMCRSLAKDGFADSIGLAADSYGWEAKSELEQGHFEAAAKLYLTQLAMGDDSAVVSLKAVIPDRTDIDGMMNFNDPPPPNGTDEELKKWEAEQAPKIQARIDAAARSPLLRKLTTAHVLATETVAFGLYEDEAEANNTKPKERCLRWLTTLEKAGVKDLDDVDHLGWVAYTTGRYDEAARWLKMSKAETATALWLDAKLKRRAGKIDEAKTIMTKAFALIQADKMKTTPGEDAGFYRYASSLQPEQSAAGDLAALHITRGEFVEAMAAFVAGDLWDDAAFIGDRVLTVDELKTYVDAKWPAAEAKPAKEDEIEPRSYSKSLRWMLARRLVREDRYDEAKSYFPAQMLPTLSAYVAALNEAANEKLPKAKRARAWFTAAYIARHEGMELMGTEEEPDGFTNGGDFDPGSLDTERTSGQHIVMEYNEKKQIEEQVKKPVKLYIPSTPEEKKRIAKSLPLHGQRWHYRYIASVLTTKAAALMTDGTEELADVLHCGGAWIKKGDEKGADKFIQLIEKRASKTGIGQAVSKKHWFLDEYEGPWSKEEEAARRARNDAKIEKP